MPEQIYTFSDEEIARMLKSGEMKLLTTPTEGVRDKTDHEKALEKAKKLFGEDFEDVQTLEIGGKSVDQLKQELQESNIFISSRAMGLLHDFTTLPKPQSIELIKLKVGDLGFNDTARADQIDQKAQELGLQLCPAEVGPHLRLKDMGQALGDWYWIAMKQIIYDHGYSYHLRFSLGRNDEGLWLHYWWASASDLWYSEDEFVYTF